VKVDVQACFDSIAQDKLLHILRQILTEVVVHASCGVRATLTRNRTSTCSSASDMSCPRRARSSARLCGGQSRTVRDPGGPTKTSVERLLDDHPDFLEYATNVAATLRHAIFVDQVRTPVRRGAAP
jgi:hypothetical protein